MQIVKDTPFEFGFLVWQVRPPTPSLTVVVKATFGLVPDVCAIDKKQELTSGEIPFDDEDGTSNQFDSDLAVLKPHGECFVTGSCYPHGNAAKGATAVTFKIGKVEKSLAVFGDREWTRGVLGRSASEPAPFTTMPLRWERSFGGPGYAANPVGSGIAEVETAGGRKQPLPNIEHPQHLLSDPASRPDPAGSFPIPRTWETRTKKTGTYDNRWKQTRWPWFPDDFDWTYFNAAPADQQIEGYWRGDETIVLQHLHPKFPRITTRLPSIRPKCFLEIRRSQGLEFIEAKLNLDTITVDTDSARVFCVWRGLVEVQTEKLMEVERAFVMHEMLSDRRTAQDYRARFDQVLAERAAEAKAFEPEPVPAAEGDAPEATAVGEEAEGVGSEAEAAEAEFDAKAERILAQHAGGLESVPAVDATSLAAVQAMFAAKGMKVPDELAAYVEELAQPDEPEVEPVEEAEPAVVEARAEVVARHARGDSMASSDYSGADLSGLDLRNADFTGAILQGATFTRSRLDGAKLDGASLGAADLSHASLQGASLKQADLTGARCDEANFAGADLSDAVASGARFGKANLRGVKAKGSDWVGADLTQANLGGAVLDEAMMSRAKLERADCTKASFVSTTLEGVLAHGIILDDCDLSNVRAAERGQFVGASMQRVKGNGSLWSASKLDRADLSFSELERADFSGASLVQTVLNGCAMRNGRFHDAILVGATMLKADAMEAIFESADLSHADLRGSSFYGAEFWRAKMEHTQFDMADLTLTKLAERR